MIKELARHIREYKKETIITPILMCLEVVMECLIPLMTAKLIDYGINGGSMREIFKWGAMLILAAAMMLVFGGMAGKTAAVASAASPGT